MNQDFKIQIPITRAYKNEKGDMLFEGIASSTSVDSHETVFNEEAQAGFEFDINDGISRGEPVELESEHNGEEEPMNVLGPVISAEIIDNTKLKIIARLDPDNPKAVYYYNKMTKKDPITGKVKQFGLSINGNVLKAHFEFNTQLGKTIRVFDRVVLKRVGIVRKPSNPDSWIEKLIRSVEWENVETKERSEKQMSKDTENQESVVEATEARNDENAAEVTDAVEAVVDAQANEDQEVNRKGDAEVEAGVDAGEQVDRATYWASNDLLGAMSCVVNAVLKLEEIAKYDNEHVNMGMTDEALVMAKQCFLKLQAVLSEHIVEPMQVVVETETETEEVVTVGEVRSEEVEKVDGVISAVTEYMNGDFADKLTKEFRSIVDEKIAELKLVDSEVVENLKRDLDALKQEKTELVERLVRVESEPATKPGAQLLEAVNRSKEIADKKADNIARAQAEGNANELIKHNLWKDKYIGYGEFA